MRVEVGKTFVREFQHVKPFKSGRRRPSTDVAGGRMLGAQGYSDFVSFETKGGLND